MPLKNRLFEEVSNRGWGLTCHNIVCAGEIHNEWCTETIPCRRNQSYILFELLRSSSPTAQYLLSVPAKPFQFKNLHLSQSGGIQY